MKEIDIARLCPHSLVVFLRRRNIPVIKDREGHERDSKHHREGREVIGVSRCNEALIHIVAKRANGDLKMRVRKLRRKASNYLLLMLDIGVAKLCLPNDKVKHAISIWNLESGPELASSFVRKGNSNEGVESVEIQPELGKGQTCRLPVVINILLDKGNNFNFFVDVVEVVSRVFLVQKFVFKSTDSKSSRVVGSPGENMHGKLADGVLISSVLILIVVPIGHELLANKFVGEH